MSYQFPILIFVCLLLPSVDPLHFLLLQRDKILNSTNKTKIECSNIDSDNVTSMTLGRNFTLTSLLHENKSEQKCNDYANERETVLISELNAKEIELVTSILEYRISLNINLELPCFMKMISSTEHETSCDVSPTLYADETVFLLKQLSIKKVAIYSTGTTCGLTLSRIFSSKISSSNIVVSMHVIHQPLHSESVGKELLSVISSEINDIIILDFHNYTVLFELAKVYGMLIKQYRWIIVEYPMAPGVLEPESIINLQLKNKPKQPLPLEYNTTSIGVSKALHGASLELLDTRKYLPNVINSLTKVSCPAKDDDVIDVFYKRNDSSVWHKIFEMNRGGVIRLHHIEDLGLEALFSSRKPKLTVVTVNDMPFTASFGYLKSAEINQCDYGMPCRSSKKTPNGTIWEDLCCSGYCVDLLLALQKELNIEIDLYFVEDGYYGGVVDGVWNGMIGDVYRKKADLAVAGLTITKERVKVVEFTEPFMNLEVGILTYAAKKNLKYVNFDFLESLSNELRIMILAMGLIVGLALYLAENGLLQKDVRLSSEHYSWKEAFSYTTGIGFQRDVGGKDPKCYGARVIAIFSAFGMTIIMTSYTAILTASSISTEGGDIVSGIRDPKMTHPTTDFKFAFLNSGSTELFFKSSNDPDFQRMFPFMKRYAPDSTVEGVAKVTSGELQGFITDYPTLHYYISQQQECRLKIVGDPVLKRGYGIALPIGSPYTFTLSNTIRKLQISHVLSRMYTKWFPKTCLAQAKSSSALPESKDIEYSGGLQLILVVSIAISIGILGFEHLHLRSRNKFKNSIRNLSSKEES